MGLIAFLAATALAAAPAGPTEAQKSEFFVRKALETPIYMMTPAQVDYYLKEVNPAELPADLRGAYLDRKREIHEAGLDKPPPPPKLERRKSRKSRKGKTKVDLNDPESLIKAGYEELEQREVRWLSKETLCSEKKLLEFSTLKIVPGVSKKKKASVRYFMHGKDPLFATIAGFRKGNSKIGGTRFFGSKKHTYCKK